MLDARWLVRLVRLVRLCLRWVGAACLLGLLGSARNFLISTPDLYLLVHNEREVGGSLGEIGVSLRKIVRYLTGGLRAKSKG